MADPVVPLDILNMADAQWSDLFLQPIVRYLSRDTDTARLEDQAKLFQFRDNVLYRRNNEPHERPWLIVIFRALLGEMFRVHHDYSAVGHLGFAKAALESMRTTFRRECFARSTSMSDLAKNVRLRRVLPSNLVEPFVPRHIAHFEEWELASWGHFKYRHSIIDGFL